MALIKCTECGHEVSDKASVCPNCGCPIAKETNHESEKPVKKSKANIWTLFALLLCLIGGGGYYAYAKLFDGESGKNAIVELTPEFVSAIQKFEKLGSFSEGFAAVMKDGKWGYINTKGEEVIPCQYSMCEIFNEGLAAVQKYSEEGYVDTEWGYIDNKGKEVIPLKIEAEKVNKFSEGLAVIINDFYSFSVIDNKGKVVFKGKCDFEQFGEDGESYMHGLYYIDGKLCIPLASDKFAIYDKQGNKTKEINQETKDELDKQDDLKPFTVFSKENGDSEDYQFYTVGLKDANGSEVIPAIYDAIGNVSAEEKIDVPNGVVLVKLNELGEDVYEGYGGEWESEDTKSYYGYADLKGNDTFANTLKQKCKASKERAIQKIKENQQNQVEQELNPYGVSDEEWEEIQSQRLHERALELDEESRTNAPSWIQGTWTHDVNSPVGTIASYKIEIAGNKMSFYRNGKQMWSESFSYENSKLIGDFHKLRTDESSHRIIDEDGNRYNGGGGSSSTPFQFKTGHDVIGYLNGKTYRNSGNSLQIRQDGCYVNGQCLSGAPVVVDYSSYSATVRVNLIPSGTITFYINSKDGTMTNSLGESWH